MDELLLLFHQSCKHMGLLQTVVGSIVTQACSKFACVLPQNSKFFAQMGHRSGGCIPLSPALYLSNRGSCFSTPVVEKVENV